MRTKRTLLVAAIAALVLVAAVGAGIAKAVSGSDETVSRAGGEQGGGCGSQGRGRR